MSSHYFRNSHNSHIINMIKEKEIDALGMAVQNAYTELHSGSKNVVVAVRNSTAYPQTLRKKTPVVRAVVVT